MVLRILAVVGALAAAPSALGQASAGGPAPDPAAPPPPPAQAQPPGGAAGAPPAPAATGGTAAGQQPPATAIPTSPPPPATATAVSPPPPAPQGGTGSAQQQPVVVEHERVSRPPLETVAVNAGYGALAGALVGGGVALIERDHVGRDLAVGTGVGVIVGAIVGAVSATSSGGGDRPARDGLGSLDRSPPPRGVYTFSLYSGRF